MEAESYMMFSNITGRDYMQYTGVESMEMRVFKEADLSEVMQAFKGFLLACGYQKDAINEYIEDE